jgi:hypothetical protein
VITNYPGFKNEYLYNDSTVCQELISPTIDFTLNKQITNEKFYIFVIDVSKHSFDLNFPQYVIFIN